MSYNPSWSGGGGGGGGGGVSTLLEASAGSGVVLGPTLRSLPYVVEYGSAALDSISVDNDDVIEVEATIQTTVASGTPSGSDTVNIMLNISSPTASAMFSGADSLFSAGRLITLRSKFRKVGHITGVGELFVSATATSDGTAYLTMAAVQARTLVTPTVQVQKLGSSTLSISATVAQLVIRRYKKAS